MKKHIEPSSLARDIRFHRRSTEERFADPRDQNEAANPKVDAIDTEERARRRMHGIFVGEIQALEGAGRTAFDYSTDEVPFELKLDMARQCWDEARHCEISVKLCEHMGGELGEYTEFTTLFEAACHDDPLFRLAGVNRALEGLAIDVFNQMRDFGREMADPVMEHCEDYMLADEVTHVKMGSPLAPGGHRERPRSPRRRPRVPAGRGRHVQLPWGPGRGRGLCHPAGAEVPEDGRLHRHRGRRHRRDGPRRQDRGRPGQRRRRRPLSGAASVLEPQRYLDIICQEGGRLAILARDADLGTRVPTTPEWDVAELITHTGGVLRYVSAWMDAKEPQSWNDVVDPPGADLAHWFTEGLDGLVARLEACEPGAEVPTFIGADTNVFWFRRMAHETTLHRWDAENAVGIPGPIAADIAIDGIDEFLTSFHLPRRVGKKFAGNGQTLHFHATDGEGEWFLTRTADGVDVERLHAKGDVAARGPAQDLLLFVWSRGGIEGLDVFGDESLLLEWQAKLNP